MNSIQVTEPVAAALADCFALDPLGPVAVKGKGEVETWGLRARKTA